MLLSEVQQERPRLQLSASSFQRMNVKRGTTSREQLRQKLAMDRRNLSGSNLYGFYFEPPFKQHHASSSAVIEMSATVHVFTSTYRTQMQPYCLLTSRPQAVWVHLGKQHMCRGSSRARSCVQIKHGDQVIFERANVGHVLEV